MDVDLAELERELEWLAGVIDRRFRQYFPGADEPPVGEVLAEPPALGASASPYAQWVARQARDRAERLALLLALARHLRPQLLDVFFTRNATFDRRFTEFGGLRGEGGFEPSGETLAFLLGAGSVAARVQAAALLDADAPLMQGDGLRLEAPAGEASGLASRLAVSADLVALFTTGKRPRPALGIDFPAQRITTALDWDDLILHPGALVRILEIEKFIVHGETLLRDWAMAARLRPGLRALFHGPPGTGKTMSVALLGKASGREVYRVDLSLVVSKYIGETEKNLARVFDRAQQRGWILFFDEADALFGKRSETRDAHDRYANQEVAYLLQRIEAFDGIAVLASNLRDNLDSAFTRRFELVVYFPMPRHPERLRLWRQALPAQAQLARDVDLDALAREHELSGGSIMNVIRDVSLSAIAAGGVEITREQLLESIRRELSKEGRQA